MIMTRYWPAALVGLWCLCGLTLQSAQAENALQRGLRFDDTSRARLFTLASVETGSTETQEREREQTPVVESTETQTLPIPAETPPEVSTSPQNLRALSPADTLPMSPLEKLFWRRHGLMRITHLFPLDEKNPTNDFRQIAKVRRRMLSLHQTLGLLTVVSMAVTVIGGQRAISGHSATLHKTSLPFTIGLYTATATMALASPPRIVPSRRHVDSVTYHKLFAVVHLAGMIVTPLIAPDTGLNYQQKARRHQISGYITFSAFTAGMLVVALLR